MPLAGWQVRLLVKVSGEKSVEKCAKPLESNHVLGNLRPKRGDNE